MDNSTPLQTAEASSDDAYLNQLLEESKQLDPSLTLCHRLLSQEIARVRAGQNKFIELHTDTATKVSVDVRVPVKEHPQFNFVGKILGPKGNSLKRIQEETRTRIAVLGKGSMKDKEKEEELRKEGGKYAHLNEELHVHVECTANPIDGYLHLSQALYELRKHLVPSYDDEVSQSQIQELEYLNGKACSPVARGCGGYGGRGGGRGGMQMGEMGDYAYVGRGTMMRDSSWGVRGGRGRASTAYAATPLARGMMPLQGSQRPLPTGIGPGSFSHAPPHQY